MGECAALFVCAAASFGEDVCSLPGPQLARHAAMWPACERPRAPSRQAKGANAGLELGRGLQGGVTMWSDSFNQRRSVETVATKEPYSWTA